MGVFELPSDPVLAAMFDLGFREASRILGSTELASLATESLRPMLEFGRQTGQLRDGLDVDAVSEWLLRELFALIDDRPWTSTRLRNHIDRFVLPTLLQPQADSASSVAARLAAMEAKLDALSALVQRSLERERCGIRAVGHGRRRVQVRICRSRGGRCAWCGPSGSGAALGRTVRWAAGRRSPRRSPLGRC
jgi:hypothetical protein